MVNFPTLRVTGTQLEMEHCSQSDFQRLLALLAAQSVTYSRVKYGHGNLEELFLHLTRKQLRD